MKSALEALLELRGQSPAQNSTTARPSLGDTGDLADGPVLDVRADLVAVLLYSKLLDRELWLCRDERAAGEIAAEFPGVPVLTYAEVPHLRGKPPDLLNALLNVKAEYPGSDSRLRS